MLVERMTGVGEMGDTSCDTVQFMEISVYTGQFMEILCVYCAV